MHRSATKMSQHSKVMLTTSRCFWILYLQQYYNRFAFCATVSATNSIKGVLFQHWTGERLVHFCCVAVCNLSLIFILVYLSRLLLVFLYWNFAHLVTHFIGSTSEYLFLFFSFSLVYFFFAPTSTLLIASISPYPSPLPTPCRFLKPSSS